MLLYCILSSILYLVKTTQYFPIPQTTYLHLFQTDIKKLDYFYNCSGLLHKNESRDGSGGSSDAGSANGSGAGSEGGSGAGSGAGSVSGSSNGSLTASIDRNNNGVGSVGKVTVNTTGVVTVNPLAITISPGAVSPVTVGAGKVSAGADTAVTGRKNATGVEKGGRRNTSKPSKYTIL